MPNSRLPKAGDKQISAQFLKDLDSKLERAERITGQAGMSYGPAGIILPDLRDDAAQLRLIWTPFVAGAFGGFADTYGDLGSGQNKKAMDAKTMIVRGFNDDGGKTPDTRDQITMFPAKGWFIDTYAEELQTDNGTIFNFGVNPDTEKLVNPGRYCVSYGFVWAVPAEKDPDTWVIVAPLVSPYGKAYGGYWASVDNNSDLKPPRNAADWSDPKVIRPIWFNDGGTSESGVRSCDSVYLHGLTPADAAFINTPGLYELSFGGEWTFAGGLPTKTTTYSITGGAGGTVDIAFGCKALIEMYLQFDMDGKTKISNDNLNTIGTNYSARGMLGTSAILNNPIEAVQLNSPPHYWQFGLDHSHGNHYTRVNLAARCRLLQTLPSGSDVIVRCTKAWIHFRPTAGNREGLCSSGYNPFLGKTDDEKNVDSVNFRWWGGGDKPQGYDSDGLIPLS